MSGSRCGGWLLIAVALLAADLRTIPASAAETGSAGVSLGDPVPPATVAAAAARWKGYGGDIQTAEIDYLSVVVNCRDLPLRPEKALELLREVDWTSVADDAEVVDSLLWRLRPDLMWLRDDDSMLDWVSRQAERKKLLWRGHDRRYISGGFEHVVHRDVHLVSDHLNKNITAYRYGACPLWYDNLTWWRTVPDVDMPTISTVLSPVADQLDFYYLNAPGEKAGLMSLDAQTGLPKFWRHYDVPHDQLRRLDLFEKYTAFPGDVLFPELRVEINVQQGQVSNVQFNLVRDARFNIDLPDDRFLMSVPEEWAWFDWRQSERTAGTCETALVDAATFFRNQSPVPQPVAVAGVAGSELSWRSVMFVVNGLVLVTIGLYLWRRS